MPGTVVVDVHESRVLRGNALGDPHIRRLPVYLPPSYFTTRKRFPVIWLLTGFTGRGEMHLGARGWGDPFDKRCDRLIRTKKMKEAIVVFPDCFTKYGGSQYINSSATGRYEDYLIRELVPFVDGKFRTIRHPHARAVMGKSSGGYGSVVQAMRHPEVFGLMGCQSGDMYFEYCYFPDIPKYLTELPKYGGSTKAFLRKFEQAPKKTKGKLLLMMNLVAMSACYAPNPRSPLGFDLPFDEKTMEFRADVWRKFLRWDPVRMIDRYKRNLRKLRFIFIDCGTQDEFQLHHGARIYSQKLKKLGIAHVHEEFDDGHMDIGYRNDRALQLLSRKLRG